MEKLYEENPFLTRFTARVRSCAQGRRGWDVILDQTAFYPEGGGQPYDLGVLGGVQVLEVHEREGHVVHTCSAPLEVGSAVEGQIDWARRFDLMQHHSGEHIVSGLAHAMYGCDNMGFHMGADVITIDLSVELTQDQVRELEAAANRYIWEDRPVQITYPSPEELAHLEYRSKKAIEGQVRIVSFPGADCCACCGTHVRRAGEVGLIKVLSCQKFREGVRMEILCGQRAYWYLSRIYDQDHAVAQLLSVKPQDTLAAVELIREVDAFEKAGAIAVVIEAVPAEVAKVIYERSNIPVLGTGCGPYSDSPMINFYDLLGFYDRNPKFVKKYANLRQIILDAVGQFVQECHDGTYPAPEHCYKMKEGEEAKLLELLAQQGL
mgnify:CR=1 FL=1